MEPIRIFISSVQKELAEERAALRDYLQGDKLRKPHHSVPANPLIAEPLYLTKYIERMGTGIRDMIQRCRDAGLPEPEIRLDSGVWVTTIRRKTPQVTPQVADEVTAQVTAQVAGEVAGEVTGEVTGEVLQFLFILTEGPCTRSEAQAKLELKGQANFRDRYLVPALDAGLIERTIPDKPTSRLQKYRLTDKGRAQLLQMQ